MERNKLYYRSPEGVCGDFIPFYWQGIYHLYYISGRGWKHITTTDFVRFTELGLAIDGSPEPDAPDPSIYTGCVMEKDGLFHMFYCGHNDARTPPETVLHAVSTDLHHWEKDPDFCIAPDGERFSLFAFRDPYVFYNEEAGEYWMLVTGAAAENRAKRWAATVLLTSPDLVHWTFAEPVYQPYMYDSHECPDMFSMGDKWYLVFSEYTRWWETKYRVADHPGGPWTIPANDTFDGRTVYAAKTVSDGSRRFLTGWICRKENGDDKTKYLWGGDFLVHELKQAPDGSLRVIPVREILDVFTQPAVLQPGDRFGGTWCCEDGVYTGTGEGFTTLQLGQAGEDTLYQATITIPADTFSAGIVFRAEYPVFEKWCMLKIEPKKRRICYDSFYKFFDDVFFDEERPVTIPADGVYHVKIITSGSIFSVYVNDEAALSGRSYSFRDGHFGLYVENGSARFTDVSVLEALPETNA